MAPSSRIRCYLALAFFLPPAVASANGGPVMWSYTSASPTGGIVPVDNREIRLVSEDLRIVLGQDARRYRVHAEYRLSNPGRVQSVTFGVPLSWVVTGRDDVRFSRTPEASPEAERSPPAAEWEELYAGAKEDFGFESGADVDRLDIDEISPVTDHARRAAQLVDIRIGGNRFPCRIERDAMHAYDPATHHNAGAWCVAEIAVPRGDEVLLSLHYVGGLGYVDKTRGDGVSRLDATIGKRRLEYALFPAGFWSGPIDWLRVNIDLGPFEGLAEVLHPGGIRASGPRLAFAMEKPDLKRLERITLDLDAGPVVRHRLLLRQLLSGHPSVSASTVLPPRGKNVYRPENVVDRDAASAWCEGAKGAGIGEWIELRYDQVTKLEGTCTLRGYVLVPGYAKSDRTYLDNGRLKSVRLSECGRPANGRNFAVRLTSFAGRSAIVVPPLDDDPLLLAFKSDGPLTAGSSPRPSRPSGSPASQGRSELANDDANRHAPDRAPCVRLTITAVEKGKSGDTCISEFFPLVDCGHWALDPEIFPEEHDRTAEP